MNSVIIGLAQASATKKTSDVTAACQNLQKDLSNTHEALQYNRAYREIKDYNLSATSVNGSIFSSNDVDLTNTGFEASLIRHNPKTGYNTQIFIDYAKDGYTQAIKEIEGHETHFYQYNENGQCTNECHFLNNKMQRECAYEYNKNGYPVKYSVDSDGINGFDRIQEFEVDKNGYIESLTTTNIYEDDQNKSKDVFDDFGNVIEHIPAPDGENLDKSFRTEYTRDEFGRISKAVDYIGFAGFNNEYYMGYDDSSNRLENVYYDNGINNNLFTRAIFSQISEPDCNIECLYDSNGNSVGNRYSY